MEEAGQPATLSAFLEEIALVADIDSVDPDQDYVLLMTLHSAKAWSFQMYLWREWKTEYFRDTPPSGPEIRQILKKSEDSVM